MSGQRGAGRMTQRRIAELAGVSQTTVSLVMNNRVNATGRIAKETRDRVMEVIRATTYVADPAARRLAGGENQILGVFPYEAAFPHETADFYTPLLTGIESAAEALGCDLLIFTSAPVVNGHRQIFHQNNRLAFADGCILLGLEMDTEDLRRLVVGGYSFVAIGRRSTPGVPYVGVDYVSSTREIVGRALQLGHRRFFYLARDSRGESVLDRRAGFREAVAGFANAQHMFYAVSGKGLREAWKVTRAYGPTVLFLESEDHSAGLLKLAAEAGYSVPGDLSIIVLGDPPRSGTTDIDFTRLSAPREDLGAGAVKLLTKIIASKERIPDSELRVLLNCRFVPGSTLAAPKNERAAQ